MTSRELETLPVRELETIALDQQVSDAIALAEARVEILNKVMLIALKRTQPNDWVDQQGKPYLTAAGAERLAATFGVTLTDLDTKRYAEKDDRGDYYWILVTGTSSFEGAGPSGRFRHSMSVMGTCSSRDQFFATRYETSEDGKREKILLESHEVDPTNIAKSAYSNLLVNAVTRILGIRGLTWDYLAGVGLTREKAGKVKYQDRKGEGAPQTDTSAAPAPTPAASTSSGSKPAQGAPPDGQSWLTSLDAELKKYAPTPEAQVQLLRRITSYVTKDSKAFDGFNSWEQLRVHRNSARAAEVAYHKLRKLADAKEIAPIAAAAAPPDGPPGPDEQQEDLGF